MSNKVKYPKTISGFLSKTIVLFECLVSNVAGLRNLKISGKSSS